MMNNQYERKFRTQSYPTAVPQQQPARRRRAKPRRRHSLLSTILMIIGAITVLVLLMRYAIVPLLVMLPQWLGGAA
ncbi:MAG: hypothetical protein J6K13_06725 [Clostridia bacterium]|nr:hypothetical protein [Clostridia bacterium]